MKVSEVTRRKRRGPDPGRRQQAAERPDQVPALPLLVLTVVSLAVIVLPVIYPDLAGSRSALEAIDLGIWTVFPCRLPWPGCSWHPGDKRNRRCRAPFALKAPLRIGISGPAQPAADTIRRLVEHAIKVNSERI
jgi:hypothetical protein